MVWAEVATETIDRLKFDPQGLIPAIVQDAADGAVLMQAYMNRESLAKTLSEGRAWYYSRSRQALWLKGESSGQIQIVKGIYADCDGDALLLRVEQQGSGACHTGERSCFHNPLVDHPQIPNLGEILHELMGVIRQRQVEPDPDSYTCYLLAKGKEKICKKVGEEASEVIIGAMKGDRSELTYEASDLVYHLLVLLVDQGISLESIAKELAGRRPKK